MKVWVVMSNDFPDCVFSNENAAERYCAAMNTSDKNRTQFGLARIYYKSYEFDVKEATGV